MSKVAIVFWSQTGNTETMANCIAEGAGANATIIPCSEMNAAKLGEYDVVAFGCPAMGAEQLEESEFEPMFSDLEGSLNGKKVAMFGSYGWGDGQWMRDWVERAQGMYISGTSSADFTKQIASEVAKMKSVAASANISVN